MGHPPAQGGWELSQDPPSASRSSGKGGKVKLEKIGRERNVLGGFGGSVGVGLQPGPLGTGATAACKGHQEGENR